MEIVLLILGISILVFFYIFIFYIIIKTMEIVENDEKEFNRRYKEFEKRQNEHDKKLDKLFEKYHK